MAEISEIKNLIEESQDNELVSTESEYSSLKRFSEESYVNIVLEVIKVSRRHLMNQDESKKDLRKRLTTFFKFLLGAQYLFLVVFIMLNAWVVDFNISEKLLLTYITSVFVETLAVVTIMVIFAYGNKTELKIIEILRNIIEKFKKL